MAKKKRAVRPRVEAQPQTRGLAPELDADIGELYFNQNATIEQRSLMLQLQTLRILRELQAAGRAARLDVTLAPEAKKKA